MPLEIDLTSSDPLVDCELPLGNPDLVVHDQLVLRGWAVSPIGIAGVAVQIGERVWNASYGHDTPLVAERLPGMEGAGRAGYELTIDTSAWKPGPCYVTIAAFDAQGGRVAVEGGVDVRPTGGMAAVEPADVAALERGDVALVLDSPVIEAGSCDVEGPLELAGWAHAGEGIETVLVTLAGVLQYEALRPLARPDLVRELGREAALEAGFALRIDPVECPPGRYRLSVVAQTRTGRVAGIECELHWRVSSPFDGHVEPDPQLVAPRERADGALGDGDPSWRSRALTAEADAALSRAETRLAQAGERWARQQLSAAESRPDGATSVLRRELAAARDGLATQRAERDAAVARLATLKHSRSWRLTRPLRTLRRALGRDSG